jgi:hypothetical protein
METCRMCGANLADKNDLDHHNALMHPNMAKPSGAGPTAGKKAGEKMRVERAEKEAEKKPLT